MLLKEFVDHSFDILNEAKVDDLVAKHPEHEKAIRDYHDADPTPTKKFLPWLVKQHVSGNVTPNDARLHSTLQHFDKVKHQLDNKDHSGYHYNDLATAVGDRVKAKLEADAKKNSVETIHKESNGITAQHIKTKEAAQNLYGGGEDRVGKKGCATGTSWCVAARSSGNMFGEYGHMYTIHAPHDENAPYAVHPFHGGIRVTSRHNDGEKQYKDVIDKKPHLKKAIAAIAKHSSKHIDSLLDSDDELGAYGAMRHPLATPKHIDKALDHAGYGVSEAAAQHPNATPKNIDKALNSRSSDVQEYAIRNPNATHKQIQNVLENGDSGLVHAALKNKNLSPKHIDYVLKNNKSEMQHIHAIRHPNANSDNITTALGNKSVGVRYAAINHENATQEHFKSALHDDDPAVQKYARNNYSG